MEQWECVYCGEPVNDGCPHPNAFECCGELGHVQLQEQQRYEEENEHQ